MRSDLEELFFTIVIPALFVAVIVALIMAAPTLETVMGW